MSYASLLTQTATYWAPGANDGFGGLTYATSRQVLVRWEDANELFNDAEGEEFVSDAVVYCAEQFSDNGFLYLGTSAVANPQAQAGAFRIRRRHRTQTPTGSIVVHKHILGGL